MKCKVIRSDWGDLEYDINEWLKTGKYEISHTTQTEVEDNITVVIFYLDSKALRKAKLDKINKQ